jgi:hypothetical protein
MMFCIWLVNFLPAFWWLYIFSLMTVDIHPENVGLDKNIFVLDWLFNIVWIFFWRHNGMDSIKLLPIFTGNEVRR